MRRNGPSGQMTINMKTTITTSGAHSGYIVNSGIQSGAKQLHRQQYASDWSLPSGPTVETPGGSRQLTNGSPVPYTRIQPSTSHESLNHSYSRVPDSAPHWSPRRIPSYEELPSQSTFSSSNRPTDFSSNVRRYPSYEEIPRTEIVHRPRTPPSPVEFFRGRESPPEEFIRPSHITLNTFNADGHRSRSPISYGLKKTEDARSTDALIHDSVMTTTTVEVFRTPLDGRDSTLLSAPPGLDDRPQLLRLNGPPYEKWTSHKTETLINDRPVYTPTPSRVQWKEHLVDEKERDTLRDLYPESRSPYEHAYIPKRSPSTEYIPTVHHVDPRLYQEYATPGIQIHRSTSPYMVQSPSEMSHSLQNLQRISPYPPQRSSSRPNSSQAYRDISPSPSYSQLAHGESQRYQQPPPLVIDTPPMSQVPVSKQLSPVYVVPDRVRTTGTQRRTEELTGDGYSTIDREPEQEYRQNNHDTSRHRTRDGYSMIDRKRSQSHHRGSRRSNRDYERTRSMSPSKRRSSHVPEHDSRRQPRQDTIEDREIMESQEPVTASTKEIFRLYQTRDAFNNVVAQFDELDFGLSDGIMLTSPLAESEESLISVLSNRNDRAKSDYLELRPAPPLDRDLIMEQVERSKRLSEQQLYEEPNGKTERDWKERVGKEEAEKDRGHDHIYEDLDTLRPALLTKPRSSQYAEIRENRGIEPLTNRPITQELQDFVRTVGSQDSHMSSTATEFSRNPQRASTAEISRAELSCLSLEPQTKILTNYAESVIVDTSGSNDSLNDWPDPPSGSQDTIPPPPPLITLPQLPPSPIGSISLSRSSSGSSISSDMASFSNTLPPPTLVQLPAPPISKSPIRKAHPDGLTFPKVASVPLLPDLPEETGSAKASSTNSSLIIVPDWPTEEETHENYIHGSNSDENTLQFNEDAMLGNNSTAVVTADDYKLKIENYQHLFSFPNESSV